MSNNTHELSFDGALLSRGFWLYVWEITVQTGAKLYYVGRTGDSSSNNAQSPFNRMGQHLGFNANSNVLRRHLKSKDVEPATCSFRLVAHGPLLDEAPDQDQHRHCRDHVAAMEKALADGMTKAGYQVINTVSCKRPLDLGRFADVQAAFAVHFSRLGG